MKNKKYFRTIRSNSLNAEEQEKLLSSTVKYIDLALFKLALSTGIRRGDIVKIEIANIDLGAKTLKFWEQKKKRYLTVPLTNDVHNELFRYLKTKDTKDRYLFNFSDKTAYNKLQRALKKAGIEKQICFHDLRRSFVKTAKKRGISINAVAQITGDRIDTVELFYQNLDMEELKDEVDKLEN